VKPQSVEISIISIFVAISREAMDLNPGKHISDL
jgi:hypothetical protein